MLWYASPISNEQKMHTKLLNQGGLVCAKANMHRVKAGVRLNSNAPSASLKKKTKKRPV